MRLLIASALLAGFGAAASAQDAPPGALACSGCHGAGPDAALSLENLTAQEIAAALHEFRSGARAATIMDRIAAGFTEAEAEAIAEWIAREE